MAIIPLPQQIEWKSGFYTLQADVRIFIDSTIQSPTDLGDYLADSLRDNIQCTLSVEDASEKPKQNCISLGLEEGNEKLGEEGYELSIHEEWIQLTAWKPAGLFYGIQTLRQIASHSENGQIPCVQIRDVPQYPWRGVLLDCARHFLDKEFIKRYIDLSAHHKLNRLHLHLTDDQGWRIEIKKYPELTKVGAYRKDGDGVYGDFYTQEDLREIVEYAEKRFVTIIPEFEMPGHASAAIASYPHLSCRGESIPVQTKWGIFADVFCPGKESTFEFLEGVLDEITQIFPSEFIHIGGDEAPRDRWKECPHCQKRMRENDFQQEDELQGYLIKRIAEFLASKNRRLIGWDEILDVGGLPDTAVVQSWRGMKGAIRAAQLHHDVISSPNQYVYFDYPQDEQQQKSKPNWMRMTPIETVYQFQPTPPELSAEDSRRVWGAECTMWTEHAPQEKIDEQLFPRICAFSETVWSPGEGRDWDHFQERLQSHLKRLDRMGVNYYRP
ncbi:MAG: beta-N-acetylhexosaminidase [Candidatus Omnitrophica bacterium]|nr:beta-N-acetylhexosaminidase [Candidatus Omnitrophota bacterium]